MTETIGNPLSWVARLLGQGTHFVEEGAGEIIGADTAPIVINGLEMSDLTVALRKGLEDFGALRTDVMYIVLIYPIIGILLISFTLNHNLLPLVFPLVTGFALIGPVAAIGLYEMSRRREMGLPTTWGDAIGVMGSPSFIPLLTLGCYLLGIFVVWMLSAYFIYSATLGPEPPVSTSAFLHDVFFTADGWIMMVVGVAVGFVFAIVTLAMSLVSFPLLVDRHVGVVRAVLASIQLVRANLTVSIVWGAIVVVALGLGVVTLFVGLVVALPVLGHATWHLYRRAIASSNPRMI